MNKRSVYQHKWWQQIKENKPWYPHYRAAKLRCNNKNHSHYHRYGGRGIKFLMSIGEFKFLWFRDKACNLMKPSIDRKDNDGDYILDNCRFIELSNNKKESLPEFHCKICNKIISKTSGKYGKGRCGSCAKRIDQKDKRRWKQC